MNKISYDPHCILSLNIEDKEVAQQQLEEIMKVVSHSLDQCLGVDLEKWEINKEKKNFVVRVKIKAIYAPVLQTSIFTALQMKKLDLSIHSFYLEALG